MKKILLVGGHHGYEEETAIVSLYLANYYAWNQSSIPQTFAIWIIPALNPDGLNKSQRNNINGVDLNRNYQTSNWIKSEKDIFYSGPSPFSEPETNAIKELLEKEKFMFVISLHTNLDYFESNSFSNRYGNLNLFLSKISQKVGYNFFDASIIPISDIITKGEFTTWLTETHNTPAITIEMKTEPNYDSFIKIRTLIEELIPWIGN
jgi:carboxypeptidase T